jgi:predicted SnoaL-like aldol condensation-catalyzing enzyme
MINSDDGDARSRGMDREILRVVGDNDIVIIFNRQSGTDDKGKHRLVLQFDMFRVENGVILEHWDKDT